MSTTTSPQKVAELDAFARDHVGDNGRPNVFIVTDQGVTVTISREFKTAYSHWLELAARQPLIESALEDRQTGVLASVEPNGVDGDTRLFVYDDTHAIRR